MSSLFKNLVTIVNTKYQSFYIGGLALILCAVTSDKAMSVQLPSVDGLQFQTSGPKRCANIGDWYTTDGSGTNCTENSTTSTDKIHRFNIDITQEMIDASSDGAIDIIILDAESTNGTSSGIIDEAQDASDPTRFQLYDNSGTLLDSETIVSGSPNGTNIVFTVDSAGTYQVTSETGARFIDGRTDTALNNDDNTFRIDVEDAGTSPQLQGQIGQFQGTMQQNTGSELSFSTYFLVGPGTNALKLRNFDLDGDASLTYRDPNGNAVGTATVSGNAVWNSSSGDLNTGSDELTIDTSSPDFTDVGIWTIEVNNLTNNNQFILEANTGEDERLGLYDARPARAGNFDITSDTTRSTTNNTPVDHPFSVSNNSATTDIINLSLSGTNSNYTAVIIDPSTDEALTTDSDDDGNVDTGILNPDQTIDLILRVTPNTAATNTDMTQISAVSYMSEKVDPDTSATRTITKTTVLLDYGDAPLSFDNTDDTGDSSALIDASDNPASHTIDSSIYLGSVAPDAETAPQNSTNANGDDDTTSPNIDDEDAFANLPNVPSVGNYSLDVPLNTNGNATLYGWVDFDKNGKFEADEYQSAAVTSADDTANLTWSVPVSTTPGNSHVRLRLTSDTLTDDSDTSDIDERSVGSASDGEVEDYPVTFEAAPIYDYGDAPDTSSGKGTGDYQTTSTNGGAAQVVIDEVGQVLSLGDDIDIDSGSLQDADALADDNDGAPPNDEDGVASFPALTTTEGQTYTVTVSARNNVPGVPAYLVGFIDFNKDGDFLDEGEQSDTVTVSSDFSATGTDGELRDFEVTFTTPAGMTSGDTYARFRLGQVEATAQQATGASAGTDNGEVEDYKVEILDSSAYTCPTAKADLWFANDESGSVDNTEFVDALNFLYQLSDEFVYDDVTGIKAGVTAWANIVNSIEVVIPITESFGDPGDSGLIDDSVNPNIPPTTDGDGRGIRELYDSRQNTNTGTRLDYATNYLADLIEAGNGRRADTPQIAIILTDAFDLQLSEAGRGGGSNWITEADRLRTVGPDGTRIVLIVIEEAADAYNNDAAAKATIDSVVGDEGTLLVVPTYSEAADATTGYIETVTQAICNVATTPIASDPNLLLVKRITAINPGQSDEIQFNSFVNDDSNGNGDFNDDPDNDLNWPDDDDTYLPGAISVDNIQPGDEVEYTIYFLSNGDEPATNVQICDVIPDNMSFVENAYDVEVGVALGLDETTLPTEPDTILSNVADTDEGTFYAPGIAPPTIGDPPANLCKKVVFSGGIVEVDATNNDNGAVVVEINSLPQATAPGTPVSSYGFIRFRAEVK